MYPMGIGTAVGTGEIAIHVYMYPSLAQARFMRQEIMN